MTKVHLIADESIGGVQREYIEVERKAEVGDYVRLLFTESVIKVREGDESEVDSQINDGMIKTLDPTDIVHINGPDGSSRYQLAERKAEVGEKVVVVKPKVTLGAYRKGDVMQATEIPQEVGGGAVYVNRKFYDGSQVFLNLSEYRVLIPVKNYTCGNCNTQLGEAACSNSKGGSYCSVKCADEAEPTLDELMAKMPTESEREYSPDIYDLLANLTTRVRDLEMKSAAKEEFACYVDKRLTKLERITGELVRAKNSLESQLRDTQNNVQTFAEQTESNTKDIAFLDERTFVKSFDFSSIKTYELSDLHGKQLRIYSGIDSGITTTIGVDVNSGHVYVLETGGAGA